MFIPTLNVNGQSYIGRLYKHPLTSQTFPIIQHGHAAGFLGPRDIAIMQANMRSVLLMLEHLNAG